MRIISRVFLAASFVLPIHAARASIVKDSNRLASVKAVADKGVEATKDVVGFARLVGPCIGHRALGGRC
jgi:hypothetical protein